MTLPRKSGRPRAWSTFCESWKRDYTEDLDIMTAHPNHSRAPEATKGPGVTQSQMAKLLGAAYAFVNATKLLGYCDRDSETYLRSSFGHLRDIHHYLTVIAGSLNEGKELEAAVGEVRAGDARPRRTDSHVGPELHDPSPCQRHGVGAPSYQPRDRPYSQGELATPHHSRELTR